MPERGRADPGPETLLGFDFGVRRIGVALGIRRAAPVETQDGQAARRDLLGQKPHGGARAQVFEAVRAADDDAAPRGAGMQPAAAIVENDGDHAKPPAKCGSIVQEAR